MCQISSLMAATGGPVAEFSSFANFEERKRKSILLMSFPKIVHQKGSFGQIRKNPLFRFCRPILDIFGLTLLITSWLRKLIINCSTEISAFKALKSICRRILFIVQKQHRWLVLCHPYRKEAS